MSNPESIMASSKSCNSTRESSRAANMQNYHIPILRNISKMEYFGQRDKPFKQNMKSLQNHS